MAEHEIQNQRAAILAIEAQPKQLMESPRVGMANSAKYDPKNISGGAFNGPARSDYTASIQHAHE